MNDRHDEYDLLAAKLRNAERDYRDAWERARAAEAAIQAAHEELDAADIQRTSFGGPFGDIKYEEHTLNLVGRIHCLAARAALAGREEGV